MPITIYSVPKNYFCCAFVTSTANRSFHFSTLVNLKIKLAQICAETRPSLIRRIMLNPFNTVIFIADELLASPQLMATIGFTYSSKCVYGVFCFFTRLYACIGQ